MLHEKLFMLFFHQLLTFLINKALEILSIFLARCSLSGTFWRTSKKISTKLFFLHSIDCTPKCSSQRNKTGNCTVENEFKQHDRFLTTELDEDFSALHLSAQIRFGFSPLRSRRSLAHAVEKLTHGRLVSENLFASLMKIKINLLVQLYLKLSLRNYKTSNTCVGFYGI